MEIISTGECNDRSKVRIYHSERDGTYTLVASVDAATGNLPQAMEYAYRVTQNGVTHDSWSMDGAADITVEAPLHEIDGTTYGLRSTSMDDLMAVNGALFRVGQFGFSKVNSLEIRRLPENIQKVYDPANMDHSFHLFPVDRL